MDERTELEPATMANDNWWDDDKLKRVNAVVVILVCSLSATTYPGQQQRLLDVLNHSFLVRYRRIGKEFLPLTEVEVSFYTAEKEYLASTHINKCEHPLCGGEKRRPIRQGRCPGGRGRSSEGEESGACQDRYTPEYPGIPGGVEDVENKIGQILISDLEQRGWRYSSDQIQFRNTVLIDPTPSEEEMLARMKQKTRYNVRLAEKKGVSLRIGTQEDLPVLYKMYAETSLRDGFVIRDEGYYQTVWKIFMANAPTSIPNPQYPITNYQSQIPYYQSLITNSHLPFAEPLLAEVNNEPVAAIFVFYFAGRAYYVYGMSRNSHREKMPAYLLQWEAMKLSALACGYFLLKLLIRHF